MTTPTTTDSARSKVAMESRMGIWSNFMVLSGFILMVTTLLAGGTVGSAFPLDQAIPILFFGCTTTAIIALAIGVIGTRTGYSSSLIYRYAFGTKGVVLPVGVVAMAGLGWNALTVNLVRDAFAGIYAIEAYSAMWWSVTIVVFILVAVPAFKSVRWISYLNWIATPVILLILGYVCYFSVVRQPDVWGVSYVSEVPLTRGLTIAIGGWITGAAMIADFCRFFRNSYHTVIVVGLSFGILIFLQYVAGAVGAAVAGDWNIFNILQGMGFAGIAFMGVFFSAWSTSTACLYGASLEVSAPPFPRIKDEETTRRVMVVLMSVVVFVGVLMGIERFIFWYLPFLTFIIAPIVSIVIVDYWFLSERRRLYEQSQPNTAIGWPALVTWAIGFVVGYYTNSAEIGSGAINSLLISGAIYAVIMRTIGVARYANSEARPWPAD